MPPPYKNPIIPEPTDPRLRNWIDCQSLDYLKRDLVLCINALMEIRESEIASSVATEVLRTLHVGDANQ